MRPEHYALIEKLFNAKLIAGELEFSFPPGKRVNAEAFAALIAAIESEKDARIKLLDHNFSVVCEENVSAGKTVVNLSLKIAELERENERLRNITLDAYDAGQLNNYGGGDVSWWHDYIRSELDRAHDFYITQLEGQTK